MAARNDPAAERRCRSEPDATQVAVTNATWVLSHDHRTACITLALSAERDDSRWMCCSS